MKLFTVKSMKLFTFTVALMKHFTFTVELMNLFTFKDPDTEIDRQTNKHTYVLRYT